ncbi:MAG: hypothetical protein GY710_22275 [Desulfobacteraceae bacterium]|nr:hypothetical protein [Desulfobacteraceae bacterium]
MSELIKQIENNNFNFAAGVPCGVLKDYINHFSENNNIHHIIAQNESEAVAITAGAYLAGKKPILYMQNSGFFKSINEFTSLLIPYNIPLLSIITYRGCEGEDAPQHFINGKLTEPILNQLNINYNILNKNNQNNIISKASKNMDLEKQLEIILVQRQGYNKVKKSEEKLNLNENKELSTNYLVFNLRSNTLYFNREDALETIVNSTNETNAIFSSTGLMSRSLYENHDSDNQFYMTGSFGQVSSIGLGFAVSKPNCQTYVIDGDGSLLTNFGSLVTIGKEKPSNLIHILIDNNAYGSCDGEKTASDNVSFEKIALSLGYKGAYTVDDKSGLEFSIKDFQFAGGPIIIRVYTNKEGKRSFKRPKDLKYISERFRNHFQKYE